MKTFRTSLTLLVATLLALIAPTARAAVIFSDNFSAGSTLNSGSPAAPITPSGRAKRSTPHPLKEQFTSRVRARKFGLAREKSPPRRFRRSESPENIRQGE